MTISSTSKDPPADIVFGKPWTLDDTFNHPDFRLLYVPPKNEHGKMMMIITPSKHEPSYVPDRKFYALSHLWGTDPKDNLWEVSGFISDEDGTTVDPIPMRKEKRKTFLELLQDNPGYWWIDVVCCRTETPPVIMRGVYGCCYACFAMIDCPSEAIKYFFASPKYPSIPVSMSTYRRVCKYARDIRECRWFSRVWTMQELALPSSVSLLSETCDMLCYLSANKLMGMLDIFDQILKSEAHSIGDEKSVGDLSNHLIILRDSVQSFYGSDERDRFGSLDRVFQLFAISGRSCFSVEDYVYGALGILGWDIPRLNNLEYLWDRFLYSFQQFAEKHLWPAVKAHISYTYIRGITTGDRSIYDAEKATKHCQDKIYILISPEARSRALSGARNMADVYERLLYIKVTCSCSDCCLVADWMRMRCGYFRHGLLHGLTIKEFYIDLQDSRHYNAGEVVRGDVVLDLAKPTKIQHIKIALSGTVQVGSNVLTLFTREDQIASEPSGSYSYYLDAKSNRFPFELHIPGASTELPTSMKLGDVSSHISYTLLATLNRPFVPAYFAPKDTREISVVERIDVSNPEYDHPVPDNEDEEDDKVMVSGTSLGVRIPKAAFVRGDTMPVSIKVACAEDFGKADVIRVALVRRFLRHFAKGRRGLLREENAREPLYQDLIANASNNHAYESTIKMFIPPASLPTTGTSGRMLRVEYAVQVSVDMNVARRNDGDWRSSLVVQKEIPVIIGTTPRVDIFIDDEDDKQEDVCEIRNETTKKVVNGDLAPPVSDNSDIDTTNDGDAPTHDEPQPDSDHEEEIQKAQHGIDHDQRRHSGASMSSFERESNQQ